MATCLLLCQRGAALGSLQLSARLPQRRIRLLPHLRHLPSTPSCIWEQDGGRRLSVALFIRCNTATAGATAPSSTAG